jgi:hypothetical protein
MRHSCTPMGTRAGRWRGYTSRVLIILALLSVALIGFMVTSMPAHAAARQTLRPCGGGPSCNPPCDDPQQVAINELDTPSDPFSGSSKLPDPAGMGNALFFYTPLDVTINNFNCRPSLAVSLWRVMLMLVDACIVLILMLTGARIILVGTVFRYADAVESLPGVLLALIAAHISMIFIAFFLGLNNALVSGLYTWANANVPAFPNSFTVTPSDLEFTDFMSNLGSLTDILGLIIKIMGLMLLAQIIIRIFFINLYIVFAPLGIACWALPGRVGQPVTRSWLSGFVSLALVQFVQVAALIVIQAIVASFLSYLGGQVHSLDTDTLTQILNVAVLWFVFRIPALFHTAPMRSLIEVGDTMSGAVGTTIATQISTAQMVGSTILGIAGEGAMALMFLA